MDSQWEESSASISIPRSSQTLRGLENEQCNDAANWLENYIWSKVSNLPRRGRVDVWKGACVRSVGAYMQSVWRQSHELYMSVKMELFIVWVSLCMCDHRHVLALFSTLAFIWCFHRLITFNLYSWITTSITATNTEVSVLFWGWKHTETTVIQPTLIDESVALPSANTHTHTHYNGIVFQAARHRWHQTSQNRTAEVSEVKPKDFVEHSNGPVCLCIYTHRGFHYKNHTYTIKIRSCSVAWNQILILWVLLRIILTKYCLEVNRGATERSLCFITLHQCF